MRCLCIILRSVCLRQLSCLSKIRIFCLTETKHLKNRHGRCTGLSCTPCWFIMSRISYGGSLRQKSFRSFFLQTPQSILLLWPSVFSAGHGMLSCILMRITVSGYFSSTQGVPLLSVLQRLLWSTSLFPFFSQSTVIVCIKLMHRDTRCFSLRF